MTGGHFSLILLPTLECNADCDYCFERKSQHHLQLDQLSVLFRKVMDHMQQNHIETMSVYFQGGEVMTLRPEWFEEAHDIIRETSAAKGKPVFSYLQSNMIVYSKKWNNVVREMFGNSVGSSMDFPNLHRKLLGGCPEDYNRIWTRKIREAGEAGIEVGVISIPNEQTFEMGAERFYSYFVDELGITDIQINTPFPGGYRNDVKRGFPLETDRLSRFCRNITDVWIERGFQKGVRISPFGKLIDYFINGNKDLLCIWRDNCVNDFLCVDARGQVAQCDCWVTSYPELQFGNIFDCGNLSDLLDNSEARRSLQSRPGFLIQNEDCLKCSYLSICHGGCPVRAYTVYGNLFRKDPYCQFYRRLFKDMEETAAGLSRRTGS